MKFKKKPIIIDAIQWNGSNMAEILTLSSSEGKEFEHDIFSGLLTIETLEGDMVAQEGDWIIRGIKGELYPCKPDIFEATYDPVPPTPND